MMDTDLTRLDGFSAWPYAGQYDHPAMIRLLNRWYAATGSSFRETVAQTDTAYAHLDNCVPATDMFMVDAPDGLLAGYVRVEGADVPGEPTRSWIVPHIDPAHRDTQLWRILAAAASQRGLDIAGRHNDETERALEGSATRTPSPTSCELRGPGVPDRHLWSRDVAQPRGRAALGIAAGPARDEAGHRESPLADLGSGPGGVP
jgi:hypothetical protein